MKRIVFMGTPDYADAILKSLIEDTSIEVVAVFTQPDKPVGRKKVLTAPPVKIRAQEAGITCYQPHSLKKEDHSQEIRSLSPDFIIVAAFGQILPQEILDIAPCINLHASILPAYRGASPIQQALLAGDTQTGVTAMLMDAGMDTGAIITIERLDIPKDMLAFELFEALTKVAAEMTPRVIHEFTTFKIEAQDDTKASYCKKISKADGEVLFDNALELYNRYRAFTPWPGIYLTSGLKLKKITLGSVEGSYRSGEIIAIEKDYMDIGCKQGFIRVFRVQPPSKNEMDCAAFVNGQRVKLADTLA